MKSQHNPFSATSSFGQFKDDTAFVIFTRTEKGLFGEYYNSPIEYIQEKLESGRDIYDGNMNELGGGWSFSSLVDYRDGLITQNKNSEIDASEEIAELNEKINSGELYFATNYHGEEHTFKTMGEVLGYFVQSFEDTENCHEGADAHGSIPAVYVLTDADMVAGMRETAKSNPQEYKHLAHFININLYQNKNEFNFPESIKYYKENLKTCEKAHNSI